MAKIMFFIDGAWLYHNTPNLAKTFGKEDFKIDYGRLPRVLSNAACKRLGCSVPDPVRTYLFGSIAVNFDLADEEVVEKRQDFYDMLREEHSYDVEVYPIDYRGRRYRKSDRDTGDDFIPKQSCVDVGLATKLLYFAAIPNAFDIAVAVLGDVDFAPALQSARLLGKRVVIASIKASCSRHLSDPKDTLRVRDCDTIWLDDLLNELELTYDRQQLNCQSPLHSGTQPVWTDYHPRKRGKFYCDACRSLHTTQKSEARLEYVAAGVAEPDENGSQSSAPLSRVSSGRVTNIVRERGFAFLRSPNGKDYYFHFTNLVDPVTLDDLQKDMWLMFDIKQEPREGKAGAADNVRRMA